MNAVLADCGLVTAEPFTSHLLFSESYLDIWHDEAHGRLHLDWKGTQTQKSIRTGAESLLVFMTGLHAYKILNDNTNAVGSWMDSVPWVVFNFLPRAKKAGMQRVAHVYGRDRLARLSAEASKLLFDPAASNIRLFNSLRDARIWLDGASSERA
jgi:hypothetical protein